MSDHDLTRGVAVRLSAFCLAGSGKLRHFTIWDMAVRGALLVDLALAGRVTQEENSIVVDATPTGFGPADALLQPIVVEPERPLDWWMDNSAIDLEGLVRDNVRSGRWRLHRTLLGRRYSLADPGSLWADTAELRRSPETAAWDPATAALSAIADSSGIWDDDPGGASDGALAATGPVRWLCQSVVERLAVVHRHFRGTVGLT